MLDDKTSQQVFERTGEINHIVVNVIENELK